MQFVVPAWRNIEIYRINQIMRCWEKKHRILLAGFANAFSRFKIIFKDHIQQWFQLWVLIALRRYVGTPATAWKQHCPDCNGGCQFRGLLAINTSTARWSWKKPIFNKWVWFPLSLHLPIEPQKNKDIFATYPDIPRLGLRLALCSRPWSGYDHMWMQPGHMLDLGHCTCMARMWWLCGIFLWNLNKRVYKLFGVNPRNLVHKIVTLWLADLVWRNLAMKTVISGEPMISLWFPGICFRLMFVRIFSNTEL